MTRAGLLACLATGIAVWTHPMSASAEERAQVTSVQEDAIVALARLYGPVRYFHPGDAVTRIPWDRFLVRAADRALGVTAPEQIGPSQIGRASCRERV